MNLKLVRLIDLTIEEIAPLIGCACKKLAVRFYIVKSIMLGAGRVDSINKLCKTALLSENASKLRKHDLP